MFQAAVAARRALRLKDLYRSALRFADLLVETFGPGKLELADGHPEVEMALIELYRESGRESYLDLAEPFINVRGRGRVVRANTQGLWRSSPEYLVDLKPLKELEDVARGTL